MHWLRAMHSTMPPPLSLSPSSFKALEFLVPDSQSKHASASPSFCSTRSLPWPKITFENEGRLTFICDTIRKSSPPPPPSLKRVFNRSSRWIQILARRVGHRRATAEIHSSGRPSVRRGQKQLPFLSRAALLRVCCCR